MASQRARWLAVGQHWRFGMGVAFRCPSGEEHEHELYFQVPCDGYEPLVGPPLYYREGASLAELTVRRHLLSADTIRLCDSWVGSIRRGIFLRV